MELTISEVFSGNKEDRVISLYQICKLMKKRHTNSKPQAEEIHNKEGFGEVLKISTLNSNKVSVETYSYTKKQALMIGARLDSGNIIKLVNELERLSKPTTIEDLLKQNVKVIGELQNKVVKLEDKANKDKPKVQFANAIAGTTSNIDIETFAKSLYDTEGISIGRNKMFKWLRDGGYLKKDNKPYQLVLDRGLMMLKEGTYINSSTNELVTYVQARITGKGQMYFANLLVQEYEKDQ